MKLIILTFAFLALTNAFFIEPITEANFQTLKNAGSEAELPDFNEVEALEGFLKGVVLGAAKANSTDVSFCVKGDGVIPLYEYYSGLALAVSSAGPNTAVDVARKYLNTVGARQLKRVNAELLTCIADSKDFQAITTRFDTDPNGAEFETQFSNFANNNPTYFHQVFTSINSYLSQGKYSTAGYFYGSYCHIASLKKTA